MPTAAVANPNQILILNPGVGGVTLFSTPLKYLGLSRRKEFDGSPNPPEIENKIFTNGEPQLLIVSSFVGEMEPVIQLTAKLRAINPHLVVVFADLAIKQTHRIFDRCLFLDPMKPNTLEPIGQTVKDFMNGILRRE